MNSSCFPSVEVKPLAPEVNVCSKDSTHARFWSLPSILPSQGAYHWRLMHAHLLPLHPQSLGPDLSKALHLR